MSAGTTAEAGTTPAADRVIEDAFSADCPARQLLNHISSRWGILILAALRDGPTRFYVLRDRIDGISEKMLSQHLRELTRDGLVSRTVEPSIPPKVSYGLTPIGGEVAVKLDDLLGWITARIGDVTVAQRVYDEAE
ncbi:winged helix-turn-helix transcriptional regulator [Kitasatospora sp. NPDC094011]|uniref:winged helix-turn-helix transcriptional regulator n=1 Tax=Kitasatospora sp. NPDC094011 TaxID=3364090 RepID=UPI0038108CAD